MFEEIEHRIKKLVENRPFAFRNTEKELAEKYLNEQMAFEGISESDRIKLEMQCRGNFSKGFREYLKVMGRKQGAIFTASRSDVVEYSQEELKLKAQELLSDNDVDSELEKTDFVFLHEEGFSFHYVKAEREGDLAVYFFEVGEDGIAKAAATVEEFIENEFSRMEHSYQDYKESGGYILTLEKDGSMSIIFDGEEVRPLDRGDIFL